MSYIILPAEAVLNILYGDTEESDEHYGELIESDNKINTSRWAIEYEMIFKYQDKLYRTEYRRGTGDEGERPFEHDDEIKCEKVEPYTETITKYRKIK